MSNKSEKKFHIGNQKLIHRVEFNIQLTESTIFAIKGVFVDKVTLTVNDVLMSVFKPRYSYSLLSQLEYSGTDEEPEPPQIDIEFFRHVETGKVIPFHAALLQSAEIVVHVYTMSYNSNSKYSTPSLMMGTADYNVQWSDAKIQNINGIKFYAEDVLVGSDTGDKSYTLVYTLEGCGFYSKNQKTENL